MTDRLFKSANSFIFGPQEERGHYQWWRQSIKLIHFWSNKYGTAHRAERERYQDVMTLTRVEASSAAHLLVLSRNKKQEKTSIFAEKWLSILITVLLLIIMIFITVFTWFCTCCIQKAWSGSQETVLHNTGSEPFHLNKSSQCDIMSGDVTLEFEVFNVSVCVRCGCHQWQILL